MLISYVLLLTQEAGGTTTALRFCLYGINRLWLHYHHFKDASQSPEELQSLICCCPLAAAAFHFRSPEHGCCGSNSSSSMMPSSDILLLLIAAGSAL